MQKAVDIWHLENGGFPATYTSLIGDASTENLEVEVTKSMDCSVDNGVLCAASDFAFLASCGPQECGVIAFRILDNGNTVLYMVSTEKDSADTAWRGDECNYVDAGSVGERICNELVAQGKMEYACNDC